VIRKSYPRLSAPFTLTAAAPATLIHATTHREEPGHILPAGWVVREEIRDDLPRGDHVVVQHNEDGMMARYWVRRADLADNADSIMYQAGRDAHRDGAPAPGEYCVEGDAYRGGWYDADEDAQR
jgi:hypothetical protein